MKLSCVGCRQKKIKCDRESPCSHCVKIGTTCVPQVRAKTVRKPRKPDSSLLERLQQLESIVSKLDQGEKSLGNLPVNIVSGSNPPHHQSNSPKTQETVLDPLNVRSPGLAEAGGMITKNGQTRYIPTGFWMALANQIGEQLSDLLDDSDDPEPEEGVESESPPMQEYLQKEAAQTSFVLGFTSDSMTLKLLHPPAEKIRELWSLYIENCKSVMSAVYVPYGNEAVIKATTELSSLNHTEEAWVFSMYYLVTFSIKPKEYLQRFGHDKAMALDRYRWATEQSLARAGFLLTQDLRLLEAFQIYCVALSRHIDNYTVRAMINLLVNVAHSMGLHRDGEQFGLPPFEVEWRRRLWWGVRTIDLRSSLDYDAQSLLIGRWSDTKLPLNLREDDIWPGMTEPPKPRKETTELTWTLLRWELTDAMIEVGKLGQYPDKERVALIEPMNAKLEHLRTSLYNTYLTAAKGDDFVHDALEWIGTRIFKMLMSRLWLLVNQPLIIEAMRDGGDARIREEAYKNACIALTLADEVQQSIADIKTGWLYKRIVDWQSLYIILFEICRQPEVDDRTWAALDRAMVEWPSSRQNNTPQLKKPLRRLYQRAQNARSRHLAQRDHKLLNNATETNRSQLESSQAVDLNNTAESSSSKPVPEPLATDMEFNLEDLETFGLDEFPNLDEFNFFETALNYSDAPVSFDMDWGIEFDPWNGTT